MRARSVSFPYVPLAVPFWNGATYLGILRSCFSGRLIEGPERRKLKTAVIERLGVKNAVLCGSGSMALEVALRACDLKPGDEVIVPTFCCTSVIHPVLAAGALPVLADVGDDLNMTAETLGAVLTEQTKAVIVPHLFGNPADISAIINVTQPRRIRVIDDAAQALGATMDGQPVGGFGDAGILSFGSEKVCFGVGGGGFVCREKEMLERISQFTAWPARLCPTVRSVVSTLVWRRWRRWTRPLQTSWSHIRPAGPGAPPTPYRKEAMSNLAAAVALSLLETLPENIAARRARVRAYQALLGADKRLTLIAHRSGSACLTQVVRVLPGHSGYDFASRVIDELDGAGYEVQGSYVPIHLLPHYEHWARKRLPHAERVWADLIELPCEPGVSFDHVERIATIVKRVLDTGLELRRRKSHLP